MIPYDVWVQYGPWILAALEALVIGVLWRELKFEREVGASKVQAMQDKVDALAAEQFKCMMEIARDATKANEHSAQAIEAMREAIGLFKEIESLRRDRS